MELGPLSLFINVLFFLSRFSPFYRTNQIFIKSVGFEKFNWTSADGEDSDVFGPVFNKTFMAALYDLQVQIQLVSMIIFFTDFPYLIA